MRIWIIPLFLVVAGVAAFWAWPFRHEVRAVAVQRGRAIDSVAGTVRVIAARDVILKAEVPGRVTSVVFTPGMGGVSVQKSDVVAQLDKAELENEIKAMAAETTAAVERAKMNSPYEIELNNTLREISDLERSGMLDMSAQAKREKLQKDAQRLRLLADESAISRSEAKVKSESQLNILKMSREKTSLQSPIDGMVVEAYVTPGDWVSVGDPVVRVISNEKLLEASLDEADAQGVQPGQAVWVHFNADPSNVLRGRVKALQPVADPETRRRLLYVSLDMSSDHLVVGATGQLSVVKAERSDALLIPRRSVWGDQVLVIRSGKIHQQPVQIGFKGLQYAEVISGLQEGDWIVADNLHLYSDGERVSLKTERQPAS